MSRHDRRRVGGRAGESWGCSCSGEEAPLPVGISRWPCPPACCHRPVPSDRRGIFFFVSFGPRSCTALVFASAPSSGAIWGRLRGGGEGVHAGVVGALSPPAAEAAVVPAHRRGRDELGGERWWRPPPPLPMPPPPPSQPLPPLILPWQAAHSSSACCQAAAAPRRSCPAVLGVPEYCARCIISSASRDQQTQSVASAVASVASAETTPCISPSSGACEVVVLLSTVRAPPRPGFLFVSGSKGIDTLSMRDLIVDVAKPEDKLLVCPCSQPVELHKVALGAGERATASRAGATARSCQ